MTNDIAKMLAEDVPREYITTRGEGKNALDYVTGRYVKQRLSEIFGWDGWSYEVISDRPVTVDADRVIWFAHVRLTVYTDDSENRASITRDGMAAGHGLLRKETWERIDGRWQKTGEFESVSPGRANEVIDFAIAEAVTDALKRAAVSLGQNLGLSLYPIAKGSKEDPHQEPDPIPDKDGEKVVILSGRLGTAKTVEELDQVAQDIAKAGLGDQAKAMLREVYMTHKRRIENG